MASIETDLQTLAAKIPNDTHPDVVCSSSFLINFDGPQPVGAEDQAKIVQLHGEKRGPFRLRFVLRLT
jgi:hypothetical protein